VTDEKWIYFDNSKRKKIMGGSQPTIHFNAEEEYSRARPALHLVAPGGCAVLRALAFKPLKPLQLIVINNNYRLSDAKKIIHS